MSKEIVIDSISTNHVHEVFNTAFLLELTLSLDSPIYYYGENTSIKNIQNLSSKNNRELKNVVFKIIPVIQGSSSLKTLLRYFIAIYLNIYILYKERNSNGIIFLLNNPLFIWILGAIAFIYPCPIKVLCHGEIEWVISKFPIYKPRFFYKYLLHIFYKYFPIAKNLKFILLGDSIDHNFKNIYPKFPDSQLIKIDHPYLFQDKKLDKEISIPNKKLVLGTIGAMAESKGFRELVRLTKILKEHITNGDIEIRVIGPHKYNFKEYNLINFISPEGKPLDTQTYNNSIEELDYILFFYSIDSYKLLASGAIFDAINHNKPIIALRNDYFAYLFNKFGNFGFLCNNTDDIASQIIKLLSDINGQHTIHMENIELIKKELSPKRIVL